MGKFIHDPSIKPADGLAGPVIGKSRKNKPQVVRGSIYAPYVVERWTRLRGSELDIYYVLSTWNPYVVDLMKTRFRVRLRATPSPYPHPIFSHPIVPHPVGSLRPIWRERAR
jgi:hypothetical protein